MNNLNKYKLSFAFLKNLLNDKLITQQEFDLSDNDLKTIYNIN